MIDTHRLTIVPDDGTVVADSSESTDLDLSSCGIPENVHALQWNNPVWQDKRKSHLDGLNYGEGSGWIELKSDAPNVQITELPEWALLSYEVLKAKYQ